MKHLLVATACALFLSAAPAQAQANRTWVSGTGDDNNGCSRTMPCKTFAGAIPKTAPNGTISVLDPGGYGSLAIGKSINIVADGAQAGVLTSGTTGFTINAGPNDVVTLRGLFFEAVTPPARASRFFPPVSSSSTIARSAATRPRSAWTGRPAPNFT